MKVFNTLTSYLNKEFISKSNELFNDETNPKEMSFIN
jgi:hypothetical protein